MCASLSMTSCSDLPDADAKREMARFESVIVHFDAKYRVNFTQELFGGGTELADAKYADDEDASLKSSASFRPAEDARIPRCNTSLSRRIRHLSRRRR